MTLLESKIKLKNMANEVHSDTKRRIRNRQKEKLTSPKFKVEK
jgi:hypothetical protein